MKYTPLLIKFVPPVLNASNEPINYSTYRLKLETPRSNRLGLEQCIPQTLYFEIPKNETLILRLVPSSLYLPLGRYKATFYEYGVPEPVDTQYWIIPEVSETLLQKEYSSPTGELPLPTDCIDILDVCYYYLGSYSRLDWVREHNLLIWKKTQLPLGSRLEVKYLQGVSLDQVVQYGEY